MSQWISLILQNLGWILQKVLFVKSTADAFNKYRSSLTQSLNIWPMTYTSRMQFFYFSVNLYFFSVMIVNIVLYFLMSKMVKYLLNQKESSTFFLFTWMQSYSVQHSYFRFQRLYHLFIPKSLFSFNSDLVYLLAYACLHVCTKMSL